jgi:pyridoxal phosphate enzyme (YggS family)
MDHKSIKNLDIINSEIISKQKETKIIAVSKTFPMQSIIPLINYGHIHYGENKVQEAVEKWSTIKSDFKHIKLHLIGKLQSNKVKFILPLFDYIHSLDSLKLAEKISNEQEKKNFKPQIFIQVNIGNENQKNGIDIENLDEFINACKQNYDLNIIGLMCIPPNDGKSKEYFKKMFELNRKYGFSDLSMGMSSDYKTAIIEGATFIRVGSKIFGERSN